MGVSRSDHATYKEEKKNNNKKHPHTLSHSLGVVWSYRYNPAGLA